MGEWKTIQLGDATTKIGSGATPRGGSNAYVSEGISLIRSQNVLDFKFSEDGLAYITEEQGRDLSNVVVQEGDVLLNITGDSVARTCRAPKHILPARVNQHVAIIRADGKKLANDFLFYQLIYQKPELLSIAEIGATRKAITKAAIEGLEIIAPEPREQRAIASVLSSLDAKIDLLHRQNKTLEVMAETLFRQWFVEEADEGWKEMRLDQFSTVGIGRTPPRKEQHWFSTDGSDVKWISIKDMAAEGSFIFTTAEYLTKKAVERFNVPIIPKDTVVLSFKMTLGRVKITTEEMLSNEAIAHFRINTDSYVTKEFLYLGLKTYQYEILGSTSTIVDSINSGMIKNMVLRIPPKALMNRFMEQSGPWFQKIRSNQVQIHTLTALRDTLLPKLMSAELQVQH